MRLGKYQLLRKLATGGMAEVFLAKTDGPMGFEKLLVIKRILPHLAEDPQFIQMFLGEAKLAAQLNHPNLVQLFDFGQAEGSWFIAMEYIDGPTLRLLLARARDLQAPISLALAARIVSSAAEGLAYAHAFRDQVSDEPLHLVHRDVSPDNILIGRSGAVKLVDFGIAKARGQSHHTQAGTVKGKVAYMAPEQLRGEPLDRRVDLYALGVVLYELSTGRMPFEAGSDASMVRAVLYDAIIPAVRRVPTMPPGLQAILDRLLAKDREARYPDCRSLHTDLEAFIRSTGEATNGFALSRLVAQLAPPAPTQPAPARTTEGPPGVTASAFAPTSPILLSEPMVDGPGVSAPAAVLEILDLDRTVQSGSRRPAPPPVAGIEPQRTETPTRRPAPSAFVFPTALEQERGSVAPVRLGMDRPEARRHTPRTAPRARSGGGALRVLGLLSLFGVLAAVGAYLGLAAAHRTDLLARVGLPVPGTLPEPGASTSPAPQTTPPAPSAARPPAALPGPVTTGAPAAPPLPPSTAAPAGEQISATGAATGRPDGVATAPSPAAAQTTERAVPPAAPATSSAPPTQAPTAPGAAAAARPTATTTPPEAKAPPGGPAAEPPSTAALDATRRGGRESDRDKLLGAFAQLETAKEATVRLESTPRLRVRMGGKIVGTTPVDLTIPVPDGPVELEFFDTGLGLSKPEQLLLKPGDNGTHTVVISKGTLELKLQDGVAVSIDGKSAGTTPLAPVSLYEGRHTVQITRGDQRERRTLEIQGNETETLEFSFPEAE